jgi:hypothetical protein
VINLNKDFYKVCKKDVDEIYNVISPYLPRFDIFNLNQSVIYEKQKTIICKAIKNTSKEIIGHKTIIKLFDIGEIYVLKDKGNNLSLERTYSDIKEKTIISLNNNKIDRYFSYNNKDSKTFIEESYDLNYKIEAYRYSISDSIEDNFNVLRNKNKVRKR